MGHSFIQKTKSLKKKYNLFFFFLEEFISHSFNIWRGPTYFLTNLTVFFFFGIFWLFFCFFFFSWKSSQCHSFIRFQSCFFFFWAREKKKTGFSFNQSILPKKVQNMNFAGEKKIRYLWNQVNKEDVLLLFKR